MPFVLKTKWSPACGENGWMEKFHASHLSSPSCTHAHQALACRTRTGGYPTWALNGDFRSKCVTSFLAGSNDNSTPKLMPATVPGNALYILLQTNFQGWTKTGKTRKLCTLCCCNYCYFYSFTSTRSTVSRYEIYLHRTKVGWRMNGSVDLPQKSSSGHGTDTLAGIRPTSEKVKQPWFEI